MVKVTYKHRLHVSDSQEFNLELSSTPLDEFGRPPRNGYIMEVYGVRLTSIDKDHKYIHPPHAVIRAKRHEISDDQKTIHVDWDLIALPISIGAGGVSGFHGDDEVVNFFNSRLILILEHNTEAFMSCPSVDYVSWRYGDILVKKGVIFEYNSPRATLYTTTDVKDSEIESARFYARQILNTDDFIFRHIINEIAYEA